MFKVFIRTTDGKVSEASLSGNDKLYVSTVLICLTENGSIQSGNCAPLFEMQVSKKGNSLANRHREAGEVVGR